jgi:hypothetical protein
MKIGKMKIGKMKIGKMKIGKMKIGKMKIGKMKIGNFIGLRNTPRSVAAIGAFAKLHQKGASNGLPGMRRLIPPGGRQSSSRSFYFAGAACCHIATSITSAIVDLPAG